jgi:hypothetical protein
MLTKIPHLSILHALMPLQFPNATCRVCQTNTETLNHFLFSCPAKTVIWQNILQEFLWPTCTSEDIIYALKTMDYHNIFYCQVPNITAHSIIYITLAEIWKAHFRLVFQDAPLVLSQVLGSIRQEIKKLRAENALSTCK